MAEKLLGILVELASDLDRNDIKIPGISDVDNDNS
jgi:hypothetical protein